jgi:hypothetical protein
LDFGAAELRFPSAKRAISKRYSEFSFPLGGFPSSYSLDIGTFQWVTANPNEKTRLVSGPAAYVSSAPLSALLSPALARLASGVRSGE